MCPDSRSASTTLGSAQWCRSHVYCTCAACCKQYIRLYETTLVCLGVACEGRICVGCTGRHGGADAAKSPDADVMHVRADDSVHQLTEQSMEPAHAGSERPVRALVCAHRPPPVPTSAALPGHRVFHFPGRRVLDLPRTQSLDLISTQKCWLSRTQRFAIQEARHPRSQTWHRCRPGLVRPRRRQQHAAGAGRALRGRGAAAGDAAARGGARSPQRKATTVPQNSLSFKLAALCQTGSSLGPALHHRLCPSALQNLHYAFGTAQLQLPTLTLFFCLCQSVTAHDLHSHVQCHIMSWRSSSHAAAMRHLACLQVSSV